MAKNEIETIVRKARALAARQVPWLAPAILRLPFRIVEGNNPPVAAIDKGGRIYFNKEEILRNGERVFIDTLIRQVGFLWVHEVLHWVRDHFERGLEIGALPHDGEGWNIAADFEINDWVPPGLEMYVASDGGSGVLPQHLNLPVGMHAEFYYEKIQEMAKEIKEKIKGFLKDLEAPESAENQSEDGDGQETEKDDAVGTLEKEIIKREIAEKVKEARRKGNVPASISRWAEEFLKPKVNWKRLLRTELQNGVRLAVKARHDYSYSRPSRRAKVYHPFIRPSIIQKNYDPPTIAVVVDTSGSITDQQIAMTITEVKAIWKTTQGKVVVIPCDAAAHTPIIIEKSKDWENLRGKLIGGGGTNMPVGVEAAKQHKPHTIVVITDGYTNFPPPPEKNEPTTIWVIWADGDRTPPTPDADKKTVVIIARE